MSAQNSMAIHPIVVEPLQSGSKGWTDQPTNIAIPRATSVGWPKTFTRIVSLCDRDHSFQSRVDQPGIQVVNHDSEMART